MKKRLLILSGPTHEYIDPVRFIGNASSGKMGLAIATEAIARGYEIHFISGPVDENNLPPLPPEQITRVTSAADMLHAAQAQHTNADIIIFAAAVADYTPAVFKAEKMPKSEDDLTLRLKATADIAATLGAKKHSDQLHIGFALQTHEGEKNARAKLQKKNFDGIVLNTPATLGAPTGSFSFLSRTTNAFDRWGCINKTTCAENILEALPHLFSEESRKGFDKAVEEVEQGDTVSFEDRFGEPQ